MATRPMTPPAIEMAEDEMELEDDMLALEDETPQGYRIVIEVGGAGDIRVGTEPLDIERIPMDDPTSMPDRANPASMMKPVSTIREALTEALDMYRAQGDMSGMTAADEAFDDGFGGDAENKRNGLEFR